MSHPDCLLICSGKDCRADKGFRELVELGSEIPGTREVHCQKVCHGPIVGVQRDGRVRWYARIRSKAVRQLVVDALQNGKVADDLKEHEDRKHRGDLRGRHRTRLLDRHRAKSLTHTH